MPSARDAPWLSAATALSFACGLWGAHIVAGGGFAAGGLLLLTSVAALRWPVSIWHAAPRPLAARRRLLVLLAVLLVAAFFRLYRMTPPGLWGDDAVNGLLAFDILDGKIRSPLELVSHSRSRFHALSNYPIAASFALLGAGPDSLRLPGILLGIAKVPLLYATVAPLFGARVALVAALFFASSPLEIGHDKGLIQVVTGQFASLLGLCLLVRGTTGKRRALTAAAGLPFAVCLYAYHAAKLAPAIGAAYAVAVLAAAGKGERRAPLSGFFAAALVFAASALPAVFSYAREPAALGEHVGGVSLWPAVAAAGSLAPLWDSLWRTLAIFHYQQGPEYHWFGVGTDPGFAVISAFLVLHGLAASLAGWRQPRNFLLLAWTAVGLAPGILSTEAPRAYRVLLATPPLYVWAAWPLVQLAETAIGAGAGRRLARATVAAALVSVPLLDFDYYFARVYTNPRFRHFQGERIVAMARALSERGPGWTGYLLASQFDSRHETLAFLSRAWKLRMRDVASLADVLPLEERPDGGALFLMSAENLHAVPALRHFYPAGESTVQKDPEPLAPFLPLWPPPPPSGNPTAGSFAVPRAALENPRKTPPVGLLATYRQAGREFTRLEPFPFYAFFPATLPATFDVELRGTIRVPEPGGYDLHPECEGRWSAWVDGRPLSASAALSAGRHEFRLAITGVTDRLRLALFWQGAGGAREIVPPDAWSPAPEKG